MAQTDRSELDAPTERSAPPGIAGPPAPRAVSRRWVVATVIAGAALHLVAIWVPIAGFRLSGDAGNLLLALPPLPGLVAGIALLAPQAQRAQAGILIAMCGAWITLLWVEVTGASHSLTGVPLSELLGSAGPLGSAGGILITAAGVVVLSRSRPTRTADGSASDALLGAARAAGAIGAAVVAITPWLPVEGSPSARGFVSISLWYLVQPFAIVLFAGASLFLLSRPGWLMHGVMMLTVSGVWAIAHYGTWMANVANIGAPLGIGGPLGLIGGSLIAGSGILAQRAWYRSPVAPVEPSRDSEPVRPPGGSRPGPP